MKIVFRILKTNKKALEFAELSGNQHIWKD